MVIIAVTNFFVNATKHNYEAPFDHDFEEISLCHILNVVLVENATEYCIYKSQPRGFQLETLEDFTKYYNLKLNVIIVKNNKIAEIILENEKCDIVVNHAVEPDSSYMSVPLVESKAVILTNLQTEIDTIYLTDKLLKHNNLGDFVGIITDLSEEDLARQVADKKIESALIDSALALTYKKAYPQLKISNEISVPQYVVWKTNSRAYALRDSINSWLSDKKETKEYKLRHQVYYSYIDINVSSDYYSGKVNKISAYDALIKKHSDWLKWDWRFVASLIYEESRFNHDVGNPSGAYGLMQLMPDSYRKFASDSAAVFTPDGQIRAGVRYLKYIADKVPAEITDAELKIRYILMSYNAGLGHVIDAYKLAQKYSSEPVTHEDLSQYMTLLNDKEYYSDSVVKCGKYNGKPAVLFAENIVNRYMHYRNLIKE